MKRLITTRSQLAGAIKVQALALVAAVLFALPLDPTLAGQNGKPSAADNMLSDPQFKTLANSKKIWAKTQHAGDTSYTYTADNGVLTIERIGTEPWGKVHQRLNAARLKGRVIEYSAEVRGSFDRVNEPAMAETGISIQTRGPRAGMPKAMGVVILANENGQPALKLDASEWITQTVRIELPANVSLLYVNFQLGRWGKLEVRNPRLVEVLDDTSSESG